MNLPSLVALHHKSYNDRDLDALGEVFDEDVEILVDGSVLHGVAAAVGYAAATFREFPRLRIHDSHVIAESGDTLVSEYQILNGDPSGGPLRPQGSVCEIWRARDGRIVAYTCYYMPEGADREDVVNVPSRAEGSKLAEDQAALRRVATLVARGVSQDELFAAVNEEVGWLVGADPTSLMRFEADDTVTLVAAWSATDASFPIGARQPLDDALRALRDDGRPFRFGPTEMPADGPFVEEARRLAIRSGVGVPIVVDGRVWGVAFAASTGGEPFPQETTARIAGFSELMATAIANAQARAELRRLAEEQAALRRVATLVARAVAPPAVFAAVAREVGLLLAVDATYVARDEPDGRATAVAAWSPGGDHVPVGGRLAGREPGLRSSVGSPIVIDDRVWGRVIAAANDDRRFPADVEAGIAAFAELAATAIEKTAARTQVGRLADEQAALRRVATLVARGVEADEMFAAVTDEVGQLLCVDFAYMGRYEPGPAVTTIAAWGRAGRVLAVGTRLPVGGKNVSTLVFETGRPARIESYGEASGPVGVAGRERGFRSAVGSPIVVEGSLWGIVIAGSTLEQPLPADTEARLASFTELVATAIANAQARAELRLLADEQAALRRVATLVARGVPPPEVFAAVAREVKRLFRVDVANICRYEPDGTFTIVASAGDRFPVGSRRTIGGRNATAIVFETGRAARIESYADATGPWADDARVMGVRSAVGTPILVEGELWGVIGVASSEAQPLPADTEARLASFTEVVAAAIANAEAWTEVAASRARVVATADETRRRLERDVHDGAQQRLVHTVITLKLARTALAEHDGPAAALVEESLVNAERANEELRELVHGVLPAALKRDGLRGGVESLVEQIAVPVTVEVPAERLPDALETTAYFIVAEALTNVVKHAEAARARVTAAVDGGALRLEVSDDGRGGADAARGSGLVGLADRVAAGGGTITMASPHGEGTTISVTMPLDG